MEASVIGGGVAALSSVAARSTGVRVRASDRPASECGDGGSSTTIVVAGPHVAAGEHDAHDPGPPDELAPLVVAEHRGHEAAVDPVELPARVAQPGHLDDRRRPEAAAASRRREREQIDAAPS